MQIHADHELPLPGEARRAVTIGAYDGVHLGHRAVLGALNEQARADRLESVVVTFDRHPAEIVRPDSAPRLLTDLDQKLELLESTGVDHVVVIHFDEARAAEPAVDFIDEVLGAGLRTKLVVVGEDFHFGHRRQGNVALLAERGRDLGFEVVGHHLVGADGADARDESQVSSTAIRRALVEGHLDSANKMLGRPHEIRGPVVAGDKRGREIGFPTANVAVPERMLMPADGIYAGRLRSDGAWLPAAIYIGHRPTFYDDSEAVLLEVHVLDFDGDLYGAPVSLRFDHRVRDDQKFEGVDQLAAQLERDCVDARRLLASEDLVD
jgi:riboflavin kinase/FMN adenylyltransferase